MGLDTVVMFLSRRSSRDRRDPREPETSSVSERVSELGDGVRGVRLGSRGRDRGTRRGLRRETERDTLARHDAKDNQVASRFF